MLRGLQSQLFSKRSQEDVSLAECFFTNTLSALTVNERKELKLKTVTARLVTRKLKAWDLRLLLWISTTGC